MKPLDLAALKAVVDQSPDGDAAMPVSVRWLRAALAELTAARSATLPVLDHVPAQGSSGARA